MQQTFLSETGIDGAHEDPRQRGAAERIRVHDVRQVRVQQDLSRGASAQAHRREATCLRHLWQRLYLAELPKCASSHAHGRETASMPSLQQKVYSTDYISGASTGSHG